MKVVANRKAGHTLALAQRTNTIRLTTIDIATLSLAVTHATVALVEHNALVENSVAICGICLKSADGNGVPATYWSASVNGVEKLLAGGVVEVRTVVGGNLDPAQGVAICLPDNGKLAVGTRLNIRTCGNLRCLNLLGIGAEEHKN